MKTLTKFISMLAAGVMTLSAADVTVFAQSEPPVTDAPPSVPGTTTTTESAAPETTDPVLGTGAFNSGYSLRGAVSEVEEDDIFSIVTYTYIPISNFNEGVYPEYFDTDNIFGIASSNSAFNVLNPWSFSDTFTIGGSFLCVESYFMDVKYMGQGNTFTYTICYTSNGESVSVPMTITIAECVETVPEEEEVIPTPSFTLASSDTYELKAGTTSSVSVRLKPVGTGSVSAVSAMLTSSDSDVIVEDVGEKTSSSSSPSFSFKVSVPETTPEGIYNLSLTANVFARDGSPAGSYSYTIPVKVLSDVNNAALSVKTYKTSKDVIKSGDKFDLTLTLENNCGVDLENIEVSLNDLDSAKFVLDGGFSKQTVSIKDGNTGRIKFPVVACDGINSVRETIGIQAVYFINPAKPDTRQTLETSVIITCEPKEEKEEPDKFDLTMTNYKVSSSAVKEKTKFTLYVTLSNSGKEKIENARLSVLGLDGTKFAINSGLTYADFDIGAGKEKTFSFEIVGCEGISSIREVIPLLIEYGSVSSEVSTTISCVPKEEKKEEENENDVFAPNIIIESYDFGGDFVTAGDTFPLTVKIKNASSKAVIENLKVTINGAPGTTDGSIAYSPANSSNSFFFETLGMKSSADIALDLLAKGDAAPNSYPVSVAFSYEYRANGKSYQASPVTETITIPLQQEDRLTVNEPEAPNYAVNVGEMCYISTSLVNKGKSGVYNVSANVTGEGFDISSGAYYIGNINSGSEEYYDAQITPNMEGDINGEIVITYEDANGNEKEQRVPFSFTAVQFNYDQMYPSDGMTFEDPMMQGEVPPQNNGGGIVIFIIGGAFLIAVIVIVVIVIKKKRKKKLEAEDDDEDI